MPVRWSKTALLEAGSLTSEVNIAADEAAIKLRRRAGGERRCRLGAQAAYVHSLPNGDHRQGGVPVRPKHHGHDAAGGRHVPRAFCRDRSRSREFAPIYAGARRERRSRGTGGGHRAWNPPVQNPPEHAGGHGTTGRWPMRLTMHSAPPISPGAARGWCSLAERPEGGLAAVGETRLVLEARLLCTLRSTRPVSTPARCALSCRSWMNVPFTLAAPRLGAHLRRGAPGRGRRPRRSPLSVGGMRSVSYTTPCR